MRKAFFPKALKIYLHYCSYIICFKRSGNVSSSPYSKFNFQDCLFESRQPLLFILNLVFSYLILFFCTVKCLGSQRLFSIIMRHIKIKLNA